MARVDPRSLADGLQSFQGGVNSGVPPNALQRGQIAFARNVSLRGGYPETRPGWRKRALTFADGTTETRFETGLFQGASGFEPYGSDNIELAASIGGRLFRIEVTNGFKCQELTAAGVNSSILPKAWFTQAEDFLILQNGSDKPIIYDGATVRRSVIGTEVPVGRSMTYALGRLWIELPQSRSFTGSDLVYGDSGTPVYNSRDAVLRFTENNFLNGGGEFAIPVNVGSIRAMQGIANVDTSLGQGPLLVFCERGVFSVNAPFLREQWAEVTFPIQTVALLGSGAVSDDATLGVNGDVWFRAQDGLRSFQVARRDFNSWVNTPLSTEVDNILGTDDTNLLLHTSAALWDNRLLLTVSPYRAGSHGVAWRGLVSLDFHNVSGITVRTAPAYDGIWTGLSILQAVPIRDRLFYFVLSPDNTIELWEQTKDDPHDYPLADTPTRIGCFIDGPSFGFQDTGWDRKELTTGDVWYDEVVGTVNWTMQYRPDQYPCFIDWHTWCTVAKDTTCLTECGTVSTQQPQYRPRRRLPLPADSCNARVSMPFRHGFEFQPRLAWTGHARIKKVRFIAHIVEEDTVPFCEPCETTDASGITCCDTSLFSYASSQPSAVAALPTPLAYYKLDSFDGSVVYDSVGTRHLTPELHGPTIVPGIIGGAYSMDAFEAFRNDPDFDFHGIAFHGRIWVKFDAVSQKDIIRMDVNGAPGDGAWLVRVNSDGTVTFRLTATFAPIDTDVTSTDLVTAGTWFEIFFWFNASTEMGIRINGGTSVTAVANATTLGSGATVLHIPSGFESLTGFSLDELALWKGLVLTNAEMLTDYNGGAGLTYPF